MDGAEGKRRDVVLVGASAGGFPAIVTLLRNLSPQLGAGVAITLHRHPTALSNLSQLLGRQSGWPVEEPEQGAPFEPGRVYLAPPDHHMLLHRGLLILSRGPKQHHSRPAIDPMFASGASAYGQRVIGVVLSGQLGDGVRGLTEIGRRGGVSLVQDPIEAPFPSMPRNALVHDHVDLIFQTEHADTVLGRLVAGHSIEQVLAEPGVRRGSDKDAFESMGPVPAGAR